MENVNDLLLGVGDPGVNGGDSSADDEGFVATCSCCCIIVLAGTQKVGSSVVIDNGLTFPRVPLEHSLIVSKL